MQVVTWAVVLRVLESVMSGLRRSSYTHYGRYSSTDRSLVGLAGRIAEGRG